MESGQSLGDPVEGGGLVFPAPLTSIGLGPKGVRFSDRPTIRPPNRPPNRPLPDRPPSRPTVRPAARPSAHPPVRPSVGFESELWEADSNQMLGDTPPCRTQLAQRCELTEVAPRVVASSALALVGFAAGDWAKRESALP